MLTQMHFRRTQTHPHYNGTARKFSANAFSLHVAYLPFTILTLHIGSLPHTESGDILDTRRI